MNNKIKPQEIITKKSQADLLLQVVALHNQIIDLRESGKIITQEQQQLRAYLKKNSYNIICNLCNTHSLRCKSLEDEYEHFYI
jgi:hypothetical protein